MSKINEQKIGKHTIGGVVNKNGGWGKTSGDVINAGLGVWTGADIYNESRAEGNGVIQSFAEGAVMGTFWTMLGWQAGLAIVGGQLAYEGGKAVVNQGVENDMKYKRAGTAPAFSTATFMDTEQAYTMRQAGMTMIQQNAMNTKKAVMGNEAMYMHR